MKALKRRRPSVWQTVYLWQGVYVPRAGCVRPQGRLCTSGRGCGYPGQAVYLWQGVCVLAGCVYPGQAVYLSFISNIPSVRVQEPRSDTDVNNPSSRADGRPPGFQSFSQNCNLWLQVESHLSRQMPSQESNLNMICKQGADSM